MATSSPVIEWPYEYKDWRITYYVYDRDPNVTPRPPARRGEPPFTSSPLIVHLHAHDKQNVRWTKRRKKINVKNLQDWYPEGTEEQLCCFICAEYMPDEVYEYFERCKEMTRCAMLA